MLVWLGVIVMGGSGMFVILSWWVKSCSSVLVSLSLTLLASLFCLTVVLVSLSVLIFSKFYMSHSKLVEGFTLWVGLFILSMLVLLISGSWWLMFIGWEGLGLTSFWLVAFYTSWIAHNGAILTFLTNRLGDCCLLACSMYWIWNSSLVSTNVFGGVVWLLIMGGLMTKSAQYPFVSWLPAAMAAPTPVSALVHSSTLVTAGLYLLIKFNWGQYFNSSISWAVGGLTLLVGSWAALTDCDLKKVVAFSTLSQLGFLFLLFGSMNISIVIFHLIAHAFFKSSLFICVGFMIGACYSNQTAQVYGSMFLLSSSHFTWLILTLVNLGALPFVSGFYSKEGGVLAVLSQSSWGAVTLVLFILAYTFAYSWRILIVMGMRCWETTIFSWNFKMMLSGSLVTSFMLGGMGYFWAMNFYSVGQDFILWQMGLVLMAMFSFLVTALWSLLFYFVTWALKQRLSFIFVSNMNQINHLLVFKVFKVNSFGWGLLLTGTFFIGVLIL